MTSELHLIGTVHRDPLGYSRTVRALEALRPAFVLVELSAFGWAFRAAHGRELKSRLFKALRRIARESRTPLRFLFANPHIRAIQRQVDFPFEYRASSRYVKETAGSLFLIDDSSFSRREILRWPELLSYDNLVRLTRDHSQAAGAEREYARARRRIEGSEPQGGLLPVSAGSNGAARWAARESHMERQVRAVVRRHPGERVAYIGGWWHLSASEPTPTLRTLLNDLSPACRLLSDLPVPSARPPGQRR